MTETLGRNWQQKTKEIVEERLAAIGVASYANKYTGEIDQARLTEFFKYENKIRQELFRKLDVYKNHATAMREEHNMQPFSWALETVDRIEQYVHVLPHKLPKLRIYEDSEITESSTGGRKYAKATFISPTRKPFNKWRKPLAASVKTSPTNRQHPR